MPNFESAPKENSVNETEGDFVADEIQRLDEEAPDAESERDREIAKTVESIVDDESAGYVSSVMDSLRSLPGEATLSADQLVEGLAKDAVDRLKASDASFADITPASKGIQALARRALKKAFEAEMTNLGGDDLEILSKLEKTLDDLA